MCPLTRRDDGTGAGWSSRLTRSAYGPVALIPSCHLQLFATLIVPKLNASYLPTRVLVETNCTVTNLGGVGGTLFTPIINYPEVAILGLSRSTYEPLWVNQAFEPRMMLPMSLSYDHRLIDGADAVQFLRWVADRLEQPLLLSFND